MVILCISADTNFPLLYIAGNCNEDLAFKSYPKLINLLHFEFSKEKDAFLLLQSMIKAIQYTVIK